MNGSSSDEYLQLDTFIDHLVIQHAEVTEVVAAWEEIYGELRSHPRVAYCTSVCVNVLACFAAHYEHEALLHEITPLCSPFCKFSPYITAIYDCNQNMLDVIASSAHSYIDTESEVIDYYGIGYRLGPVSLSTEGHGCITNNQLLAGGKITSVIDIVLERDDMEMLAFLMKDFTGSINTLAGMASRFKSKHCLEHIQDMMGLFDAHVDNCNEHFTNLFKDLLYFVSSYHGTTSHLHIESAVNQWQAFRRYRIGKTPRSFMSTNEQHTMACLTDGGKIKHNLIMHLLSSDDHDLHQMYHNITLENCAVLEKNIEESVRTSSNGILPSMILAESIYNVHNILACFPFASSDEVLACCRSLKLHNAITKLILQTGVQVPTFSKCSEPFCLCSDGYQKGAIIRFFIIMRFVQRKMDESPSNLDEEVLRHAHEHLMTLLAYGYTQDDDPFSFTNFTCPQLLLNSAKNCC